MEKETFINKLREAFGERFPLPIAVGYSRQPKGLTPAKTHCMIKHMLTARGGEAVSLSQDDVLCRGGKVYAGYADMNDKICNFVSGFEKYKETPESVASFAADLNLPKREGEYLNFLRIDSPEVNLKEAEGIVFFVNPDALAGLWSWANFDINEEDGVIANFGSGCSSSISNLVRENRIGGHRCFIGMLDISVRPLLHPDELTFAIPRCRLEQMMQTIDKCCLSGAPAWQKVKSRIEA